MPDVVIPIGVLLVIAAWVALSIWYRKRIRRNRADAVVDPSDVGGIWEPPPRGLHQPHPQQTTSLFYDPPHDPLGPSAPGAGPSR
jgi:hypothetical protein